MPNNDSGAPSTANLVAIETWAYAVAQRVARETGWRASQIYAFAMEGRQSGASPDEIERLIARITQMRIAHESFRETVHRLSQ